MLACQVLGILHSAQLCGLLSARFLGACGAALRRVGAAHDAADATPTAARPPVATGELKAGSPQLLRSLPDRAVLYKPEGWASGIYRWGCVTNQVHFMGDFSDENNRVLKQSDTTAQVTNVLLRSYDQQPDGVLFEITASHLPGQLAQV